MIVTSGMSKLLHSHSTGPSLKILEPNTDDVTNLHSLMTYPNGQFTICPSNITLFFSLEKNRFTIICHFKTCWYCVIGIKNKFNQLV
jgi:hypothetical protein